MARGDRWRWALIFSASLVACVTNHAQLEKQPDPAAGGRNNTGGSAGARSQAAGAGGSPSAGTGHSGDEPPGQSVLTFVNGVVDAAEVALCWGKVGSSAELIPFGEPIVTPALEYGHALVLHEIAGADWAEDSLQPLLIAGELELIAGLDCRGALELAASEEGTLGGSSDGSGEGGAAGASAFTGLAGSLGGSEMGGEGNFHAAGAAGAAGAPSAPRARLRARGLPSIVAGSLSMGRSLVLVANGCLGGAGFMAPKAEVYCGEGYSERQPTVSAVLVSLSRRVAFDSVGMQVVNASLSNETISLRARAPSFGQETGLGFANAVAYGQVAPRPASLANTVEDYGSKRAFVLEVQAGSGVSWGEGWAPALARGGLAELSNGATYALVFSGPAADRGPVAGLWNGPALTVIAADPE